MKRGLRKTFATFSLETVAVESSHLGDNIRHAMMLLPLRFFLSADQSFNLAHRACENQILHTDCYLEKNTPDSFEDGHSYCPSQNCMFTYTAVP